METQNYGPRLLLYIDVMAYPSTPNTQPPLALGLWTKKRTSVSHLRNEDYNACLVC